MVRTYGSIVIALVISLMLATVGCVTDTGPTQTPADFYKGKTIELVTDGSPGSMTDLVTRGVANYLAEDTDAAITVTNRRGAGGMEGTNYLYKSEPDGLTLGMTSVPKFLGNKILDDPVAEYEIEEFSYLIGIGRRLTHFFVAVDGPYQSIIDIMNGNGLTLAGGSPSGYVSLSGLATITLLDLDAKVITGFSGQPARTLAVTRGETTGLCMNVPSVRESIEAGMIRPLCVLATERDPLAPDIPAVTELVDLSKDDLALVQLCETAFVGSAILITPPGMSDDRLEFLRSLTDEWVLNSEFRDEMDSISGYNVQTYLTGEDITESMRDMADAMKKFQAVFIELIEKYRA